MVVVVKDRMAAVHVRDAGATLANVQVGIPESQAGHRARDNAFSLSVWDAIGIIKVQLIINHGENNA
jgi:hypothetical protein